MMREEVLFELKSIYRDNFRTVGLRFGEGEKTCCIVGGIRGNEFQQMYVCSQIVKALSEIEDEGRMVPGKSVLVIPAVNPYSFNIQKRFWPTDNTDINRMFPGYSLGETTQRIAGAVFDAVKDYEYGIHFASNYIPGRFLPHVRLMHTGYTEPEIAEKFGLPYIVLRDPRPYDTTTLNYNWQVWSTKAFTLFTRETERIDKESTITGVEAVLNFLSETGVIKRPKAEHPIPHLFNEKGLVTVKSSDHGLFESYVDAGDKVFAGDVLADILNPYTGKAKSRITAPCNGIVFFSHAHPLAYSSAVLFKLIARL